MTAMKKPFPSQTSSYKLVAAARRAKVASMAKPITGEVKPSQGRLRIKLDGQPIRRERELAFLGASFIDIPEFSTFRKRKSA